MNAADGTGQTNCTNNSAFDGEPDWSPDGTKIAFSSNRDGNSEIYVMNANCTGTPTKLTDGPGEKSSASWSPDGTKILFTSNPDGQNEIYVMSADGTNQTNLTNSSTNDSSAVWSPDGTKIAWHSGRPTNSGNNIWVMNADGSDPTQLTSGGGDASGGNISPDWQPLPTEDSDGDGIHDNEDDCPHSNLSATVVIDGCNAGVTNTLFASGCTISDLIAECAKGASDHGQFVSCVSQLTNVLKKAGTITGQQKGAIQSCAAQAHIP